MSTPVSEGPSPEKAHRLSQGRLVATLSLCVGLTCVVAWGGSSRTLLRSHVEAPLQMTAAQAVCGGAEEDVDYDTGEGGDLYSIQGMPSAAKCCAKCEVEWSCGAWTWGKPGKTSDMMGISNTCFLKKVGRYHKIRKVRKLGVVSGKRPSADQDAPHNRTGAGGPDVEVVPKNLTVVNASCGLADSNVDYFTGESLYNIDGVENANACCARCKQEPRCITFSWGESRDSPGLTDVCFLKALSPGTRIKRVKKNGVLSGVPSDRVSAVEVELKRKEGGPEGDEEDGDEDAGDGEDADGLGGAGEGHGDDADRGDGLTAAPEGDADTAVVRNACGPTEEGYDYHTDSDIRADPDVKSAWECCKRCRDEYNCRAWTWGMQRHVVGLTDVCFLKALDKRRTIYTVPKDGLVSGLPSYHLTPTLIRRKVYPTGSLFCFALTLPFGHEPELLRLQHDKNVSIFGCDEYAVYSNTSVEVTKGVRAGVVDSDLHCNYGGDCNTCLNSWIFIEVWKRVLIDGLWEYHDWTVKVDADSVFFPERLRVVLADHKGVGYVNNCHYGLHGPIEVFSRLAVAAYAKDFSRGAKKARCVKEQHFGLWGEDMFMDQCLSKVLEVSRDTDPRLICEDHCDCPSWKHCNNGTDRVVYHPFKTVEDYRACLVSAGFIE